jgi:hypothetical protein
LISFDAFGPIKGWELGFAKHDLAARAKIEASRVRLAISARQPKDTRGQGQTDQRAVAIGHRQGGFADKIRSDQDYESEVGRSNLSGRAIFSNKNKYLTLWGAAGPVQFLLLHWVLHWGRGAPGLEARDFPPAFAKSRQRSRSSPPLAG